MKIQLAGIFFIIVTALQPCIAEEQASFNAVSQAVNKSASSRGNAQNIPLITNEAEYAKWVQSGGTGQTGSVKSTSSKMKQAVSSRSSNK